jgi:hypothetical protein
MSKTAASQPLLQLLVRVYNQSIQTYFHFPDVIICGKHRLEKEDLDLLLIECYIEAYYTDSFGKLYRLSKKGQQFLQLNLHRRKARSFHPMPQPGQVSLPFY